MKTIEECYQSARKDVKVCCDENHAHSAQAGCLCGDPHAINVCLIYELFMELLESIQQTNNVILKMVK